MSNSTNGREQFRQQIAAARRSFQSFEPPKQEFLRREVVTRPSDNEAPRD